MPRETIEQVRAQAAAAIEEANKRADAAIASAKVEIDAVKAELKKVTDRTFEYRDENVHLRGKIATAMKVLT